MYSKEKGFTHAPVEARTLHRPNRAPRVSIPPNYRGHAILDEERMRDGEERQSVDTATPVPRFEGLPRISQLGDGRGYPRYRSGAAPDDGDSSFPGEDAPPARGDGADGAASAEEKHAAVTDTGLFPPPRPVPLRNAFGGGLSLGTEELLLLGLILLLLREGGDCADRGDLDETVILLGLLLLLG